MTTWVRRAAIVVVAVIVCGTASSGANYTASSTNVQGFTAASDFGVHVTMNDPLSPRRGTVNLSATVTETNGGTITAVVYEKSPAGTNTWTTACTPSASPWSCNWVTSGNGTYDLRARATNNNGYSRTSAVIPSVVIDNSAPTVTMTDPGAWFRGTISLQSTTGDTGGSGMASVAYEYKTSAGSTWLPACSSSASPYSCNFDTTGLTTGTNYDFRATATDGAGNATTSASSTNRRPDNVNPTGSLTAPLANLRGTVTLATTSPADAHSGLASVTMEYSAAGANSWSLACSTSASPWSCAWDTTQVANQLYDVRALITDVAGNTLTSTVTNRRVDNAPPTTSLTDPGSPLSGTIPFSFSSADTGGSGLASGKVQYTAAGGSTWTDACADAASPYTACSFNSTILPDALYDFRSFVADAAGNTAASTVVANRRVDNFVPSGADVQTANGGATPGVIEPGDTITLTYSEEIDPSSIIAGWDGSGTQSLYVGFAHAGSGDTAGFYSAVNPFPALPLGSVNLKADYVPSGGGNFAATMTRSGATFTITLGVNVGGGVNSTAPAAAAMVWTPAAGAKDWLAKACSVTTRTETGTPLDREF